MDNIIDLLIVLFFIFSAFGSLFKKKPGQNTTQKAKTKKSNPQKYSDKKKYSENPFDLFNVNDKYKPDEIRNVEAFEDELSKNFEQSKKSLEDLSPTKRNIETKIQVPIKQNETVQKIRKLISNKESLRQAFIFSEIISKPKALNHSGKNIYY